MTIGYNVVLPLFFLSPGFAVYAGIFFGAQRSRFGVSPPAPSSIFSLALISFTAMVVHGVWATVLALQDSLCASPAHCIDVPFHPNVYASLLAMTRSNPPASAMLNGADAAAFLLTLVLLSGLAFAVVVALLQLDPVADLFRRSAYAWLADLVAQAAPKNRYVTAFVITNLGEQGAFIGYEGLLENMTLGADKQITAILLSDCNPFLLRIGRTIRRERTDRTTAIPRLFIEGDRIQNVAFNVYEQAQ